MTFQHKQFEVALKAAAKETLKALSEKERVHFALKIMLDVNDASVASALRFAANRITEHSNILLREAGDEVRG